MKFALPIMLGIVFSLTGCSGEHESTVADDSAAAPSTAPEPNYDIPMTNLQAVTIGPFHVQPMFEEKLSDGHFNLRITGPEFTAVREWIGPEDASGVVVVKTIVENDYQHGHIEMPDPIPADAKLWIEIETSDGGRVKGSVPLIQ